MYKSNPMTSLVGAAMLFMGGNAQAHDETKYPDWKGQWTRFITPGLPGQPSFDQTKPWGKGQQAPLTPEYQAIFEASLADQATGGHGNAVDVARCVSNGMPYVMIAYQPLEFVLTPEVTYVIIADQDHVRRIYADGHDLPKDIDPTYLGYSIGRWVDEDGDGRYDVHLLPNRSRATPMRLIRVGCCPHATWGHAAETPTPATNSRRLMN
jgi:hypothetical protein